LRDAAHQHDDDLDDIDIDDVDHRGPDDNDHRGPDDIGHRGPDDIGHRGPDDIDHRGADDNDVSLNLVGSGFLGARPRVPVDEIRLRVDARPLDEAGQ
jgi:hypothetical protein